MDEAIIQKIASIPGVSSVSVGRSVPMDNNDSNNPVYVQNHTSGSSEIPPVRRFNYVAARFFSTLANTSARRPGFHMDGYIRKAAGCDRVEKPHG